MAVMNGFVSLSQRAFGMSKFGVLLCFLLVISVTLNVILSIPLRDRSMCQQSQLGRLAPGDEVGPLIGDVLVGGHRRPYRYEIPADKETLIYFSSKRCKWSQQNLATFAELARQVQGRYQIVAVDVTPGPIEEASHLNAIPAEVVLVNPNPTTLKTYKVTGTPLTVLVSRDGMVEQSWSGAYIGKTQQDVSAYFRIQFADSERGGR